LSRLEFGNDEIFKGMGLLVEEFQSFGELSLDLLGSEQPLVDLY